MYAVIEENLGSLPARRAAECRTLNAEPGQGTKRTPNQQRTAESIRLVTNARTRVRFDWRYKRTANHPKLSQLIVALPCNQMYMMGQSKLRIKHDTEVVHTSRE